MKKFILSVSGLLTSCTPFNAAWNPLDAVLGELTKAIGGASFIAGAVLMAAFLISVWVIGGYIRRNWKIALLLCAVAAAIGLLLIGIKM